MNEDPEEDPITEDPKEDLINEDPEKLTTFSVAGTNGNQTKLITDSESTVKINVRSRWALLDKFKKHRQGVEHSENPKNLFFTSV